MDTDSNSSSGSYYRSTSTSSLSGGSESQRQRIMELEDLLSKAGQHGLDLLNANKELTVSLEETEKAYSKKLEVLKEENYSLTQKVAQKSKMETEYQEEIESLKKQVTRLREKCRTLNELSDQTAVITDLKQRLHEMEMNSDKLEAGNKRLANQISSTEKRLEEANEKIKTLQDNLNSKSGDEISSVMAELHEAIREKEVLASELAQRDHEILLLTQQVDSHKSMIDRYREELNDSNAQLSKISNQFMAASEENQELRCEIDMLRTADRDHKKKGNSMFSELDDKRQEAEKKLLALNVQYDSLQNQHSLTKKQMSKLKMQMSNVLRLASGQVDSSHVSELENQLHEARNEIQTLNTKLGKLRTTDRVVLSTSQTSSSSNQPAEDSRMLTFTQNLLKTKEEEITSLNKELQEKRLQTSYDRQKINDIQHKLREMESKANKLQAHNLKLTVRLEDMKKSSSAASSISSSVYNIKLETAELEKIPDFSPELANHLLGMTPMPTSGDDNCSDSQSVRCNTPLLSEDGNSVLLELQTNGIADSTQKAPVKCYSPPLPDPPYKRAPGHCFNYPNTSDSKKDVWNDDDQVNAKSCDTKDKTGDSKENKPVVVNVTAQAAEDPNNCATQ